MAKFEFQQGNEHRTHTYPDGREKYTVNGVKQSQHHNYPQVEAFVPPAPPPPPQLMGNSIPFPAPPIMGPSRSGSQRPSPTRHHSWEHNMPPYMNNHGTFLIMLLKVNGC